MLAEESEIKVKFISQFLLKLIDFSLIFSEVVIKNLEIPTGEVFRAKVCQDNSKALMTNPNKAMSDWFYGRFSI